MFPVDTSARDPATAAIAWMAFLQSTGCGVTPVHSQRFEHPDVRVEREEPARHREPKRLLREPVSEPRAGHRGNANYGCESLSTSFCSSPRLPISQPSWE